jgi:hypothetical protein
LLAKELQPFLSDKFFRRGGMRRLMFVLLLLWPASAWAQIDRAGWSFNQHFQGGTNASGTILKSDSTVGYALDPYLNVYGGLPIYFTRPDLVVAPGGQPKFLNGVGNLYIGVQTPIQSEVANYTSDVVLMLPTGSKDRGLNTGRLTFDWNNNFSRAFGPVAPFGNLGVGNTISDSLFFIRPFTSLGLIGHFEGGAALRVTPNLEITGSAYSVRAAGTQRIISRVVDRPFVRGPGPGLGRSGRVFETTPEVRVPGDLVNDHGFASWVNVTVQPELDFQVGFGRSFPYDYDSLFFGVGYSFGTLRR